MCLNAFDQELAFPTKWTPFGTEMERRQISAKEFEARYVSQAAADRAIARLAMDLIGRPRTCDHCSRPIEDGRFAYLCGRCGAVETTERELADRRSA